MAVATRQLRVIHPESRVPDVCSGAMVREAAIAGATVGAEGLWIGYVEVGPGLVSAAHHHGVAESGIYIISGRARFYSGDDLGVVQDAAAGDFIWVPPHTLHVEQNLSTTEPVRMVVSRSTQDNLTTNAPNPEGWAPRCS
jgi:uncharacterized RmlC-like cupin family protein